MEHKRRGISSAIAAVLAVAMLIVGFGAGYLLKPSSTGTLTETSTSTAVSTSTGSSSSQNTSTSSCVTFPGQPQGAYLRVVHDSDSTPVAGVGVTAYPSLMNGCASAPLRFTTNGTEWYPLPATNVDSYQITVSYLRHDYNLTMSLGLSIWTCKTLYLPSGNTSVTTSAESSCASPPPAAFTASNGVWKFEVQLNPISLSAGTLITYSCSLINISNQTRTVLVGNPLCTPTIYTQAGQLVWSYTQSATNAVQMVGPGQSFGLSFNIPSSDLLPGDNYILNSYPDVLTGSNPEVFFGQNLQVNATIQVAP